MTQENNRELQKTSGFVPNPEKKVVPGTSVWQLHFPSFPMPYDPISPLTKH